MEIERLLHTLSVLENMPRTGWLQRGVPPSEAETIAEHTFKVTAILGFLALGTTSKFDREKVILMGMIHDFTEAASGDLPRSLTMVLGHENKERIELELFREVGDNGGRLAELFSEYIERETPEAKIVKFADVLATLRQAETYLRRGFEVNDILESCRAEAESMMNEIDDAEVREFCERLWAPASG